MSYLKFDKAQLVNTEYSLTKEFIRTNRAGSFASSTIINCNTRKYHGLLICPIAEYGGDMHVLLSSLDETVIQRGAAFNLGIHKYPGQYNPKGHKYVREYEVDPNPAITYRVGGVLLRKELLLVEKEQRLLVKYTLLEANSATTIRFQPFLAFRNIHALTKANMDANTRAKEVKNGIGIKMYDGFPQLFMQTSRSSEFVHAPDWFYNIEYKEEKLRGYECHEDLFVPGYFEMEIKKGEPIVFAAGTSEVAPNALTRQFNAELKKRINRDSFESCLTNAAQQSIAKKGKKASIINGFPFLSHSERNTYLSLPGLCLARQDEEAFLDILNTSVKSITNRFYEDKALVKDRTSVDVPLWFFWTLQKYIEFGADKKTIWTKYRKIIKEILQAYKNGSHLASELHENGLLWTSKKGVTWMKVRNNGTFLQKRMGYVVEVNALWYNAICFALELSETTGDKGFAKEWGAYPQKIEENFIKVFWNDEKAYLADYVMSDYSSWSIRPNMLFAASLPYSCLSMEQKKSILDKIESDLLTPRGLRTLSPNSQDYLGVLNGNEYDRNRAFHNGSVFPWLFGHYAETYLKLHKSSGVANIKRLLEGFESCVIEHGIGSLSQVHDGNPPHKPNEATSYALSVAEILRVGKMINNTSKK
ncbi:glycogen debranching enzyme N-terminal domain-containing protein [Carboxylicivirga sp. M1479]|uniref:glycogen debranching enzyme N-terminal domain-containing protein n=1 Tax=Carboxylicivirga sp. M1479 TaxID=2594476 RepID=UPI001177DE7D|nr:glycogen debranching enzyme N-terminal domain-containing protein [Carboxylicivirga sp. M1479]TRX62506.1 amylo-alpha-1,6-glucosidase [Carboxylicivirga sp. M1479]